MSTYVGRYDIFCNVRDYSSYWRLPSGVLPYNLAVYYRLKIEDYRKIGEWFRTMGRCSVFKTNMRLYFRDQRHLPEYRHSYDDAGILVRS